eukprot:365558-Chlamydomonas_euryale.AAC.11
MLATLGPCSSHCRGPPSGRAPLFCHQPPDLADSKIREAASPWGVAALCPMLSAAPAPLALPRKPAFSSSCPSPPLRLSPSPQHPALPNSSPLSPKPRSAPHLSPQHPALPDSSLISP